MIMVRKYEKTICDHEINDYFKMYKTLQLLTSLFTKGQTHNIRKGIMPSYEGLFWLHCWCHLCLKEIMSHWRIHKSSHVGNCKKFYFTIKFKVWMWVQIYQIFESDWIPICNFSNKLNPNTDKPKDFCTRLNMSKY